jgi:glycosyltransferase involved in cell wall biosynthesis
VTAEAKLRLGYLVPEFPGQTHIFFWREVGVLRRLGEQVYLLSTRKPAPLICRHDFAPVALAETRYLSPPAISNLVRWIAEGHPGWAEATAYLRGLEQSGLKDRLRMYGLLASAVDLVRWAQLERIDHIHAHSCADAAHVLALARSMGGPPYSLALHGDLQVYGTDHRSKMKAAAFVCVVGDHLRRQVLEQTDMPGSRIYVTWMGVETSALSALGTDRPKVPGVLHLVTVARLHYMKGLHHALAAIHRGLKAGLDLRYTIAGEGPYRETLISSINQLGLGSNVTLAGTLSETEVFQLLSKADAFLLPSIGIGEAWPVSIMEAMAAGLPVVASIIGATPQMITSGEDGFLVPQSDEQVLFEKIALLAKDLNTRRRIGEAARRTAKQRFDVTISAAALRSAVRKAFDAEGQFHSL